MKTIREGTFETNSSSTHSLVMYSDKEKQALTTHDAWFNMWMSAL